MCPNASASSSEAIPSVPTTNGEVPSDFQAVESHSAPSLRPPPAPPAAGTDGKTEAPAAKNPYAVRPADFLSNVSPS